MNQKQIFVGLVAHYQAFHPLILNDTVTALEDKMAQVQSDLAAARKAQKNQKRAAKDRKKVVG